MTVEEAAQALDLSVDGVKKTLGKSRKDAEITDVEFETLASGGVDTAVAAGSPPDHQVGGTPVTVYISSIRKHTIPYTTFVSDENGNPVLDSHGQRTIEKQTLIPFKGYRAAVQTGCGVDKAIRSIKNRGIMRLIEKPFDTTAKRSAFRQMLMEKVFTGNDRASGRQGFAPRRGHDFLTAWFRKDEAVEVARMLSTSGPMSVVDLIVESKSYELI